VLKKNAVYLTLSLMLVIALGLALLCIPKGELHLLLCNRHTPVRDIFYRYYTTVAEWFPYVVCVLILLFSRIGDGLFASACMILSALTTQFFKHLVNAPRPLTWFAQNMPDVQLPLAEGVRMNYWYSFPSGHTTSFFALTLALSIIITKEIYSIRISRISQISRTFRTYDILLIFVQAGLFFLATLGAYSRIYLSQHFAADVLAGILVGVLIPLACYTLFTPLRNKNWYNYRIFRPSKPENAKK